MRIVVLDGKIANPGDLSWGGLEKWGEVTVYQETPPEQVIERAKEAEALIVNKVPITREVIKACKQLKYIGLLSTGYNVIDLEAAREREIPVCNVPGYSTDGVAQQAFALLLEICNHVGLHSQLVHEGKWAGRGLWSFWERPMMELAGKTFGVIGFGSIGKASGAIARAFKMDVIAAGSRPTPEGVKIGRYTDMEEVFEKADILSLHCPLLPETQNLIRRENIEKMKDGVILLNTARGGLVNEQDLADALESGKIRAAGLDVTAVEPMPDTSPLKGAKNCFITPHTAWVAYETRQRLLKIVADNLGAFIEGKPVHVVNP